MSGYGGLGQAGTRIDHPGAHTQGKWMRLMGKIFLWCLEPLKDLAANRIGQRLVYNVDIHWIAVGLIPYRKWMSLTANCVNCPKSEYRYFTIYLNSLLATL